MIISEKLWLRKRIRFGLYRDRSYTKDRRLLKMRIGFGCLQNVFYHNTSKSTAFRALGRSWIKAGHEVLFINRKLADERRRSKEFLDENADLLPRVIRKSDPGLRNLDVIFELYDYGSAGRYMIDAKIRTGIFVWALSPLSEYYTKQLIPYRKPIFVAGKRSYEEAKKIGIDVHLYLPGIDHNLFNSRDLKRSKTTKFLWIGSLSTSSGPDLLLRAYFEAFKPDDNVLLTIVSPKNRIRRLAFEMFPDHFSGKKKPPPLKFIKGIQSPATMAQIYKSHNALVMPIRFHGACRPVSEAMACGTLVVTTSWTGPTDFADSDEALWIDYELEDAIKASKKLESTYFNIKGISRHRKYEKDATFKWAKPSVDHLVKIMKDVYQNNYDQNIIERALVKAKTFSWEKTASEMLQVLEEHI